MLRVPYRLERLGQKLREKYLRDFIFVHINKTGGSSVEQALGLPFSHKSAREIIREIGERRWNQRFSFTIVRNPWDKVASHYFYRVKTNQTGLRDHPISFLEWVRRAYGDRDPRYYDKPNTFMPQVDWITDEAGSVRVDFIGRFESLQDDFHEICRRIGKEVQLPHLKSSEKPDYRRLYDTETMEIVERRFRTDLDLFGYRFDS